MIREYRHNKVTWVDVENPTPADIQQLKQSYGIHSLVAEELLVPTYRSKADLYDNLIYLVLHFPTLTHHHSSNKPTSHEIDIILGKQFLITTHYEELDPLLEFSKIFEVESMVDRGNLGQHAGYVFFYLMRRLYSSLLAELDFCSDQLFDVEDSIFQGQESKMVRIISDVNRHLLDFKQAIKVHGPLLESTSGPMQQLFGHNFKHYLDNIIGEYKRVYSVLESHRETLQELKSTNDSLLSTKTNEIMKVLTIMAFLTLPATLIAGVFGMNTVGTPIIGSSQDFWVVVGIMLLSILGLLSYFKYKKWI